MAYKMRFVQNADKSNMNTFLGLEKKFIELEKETPQMKQGKRYVSVMGKEPTNTMIWEAEFDSLEDAVKALQVIENNGDHDVLLEEQVRFMRDTYVEVYKEIG